MSDDAPRNSNSATTGILAIVAVLPLIYAFSIGPVAYGVEKFPASRSMRPFIMTFYEPLTWLHDHTSLKQPLESYVDWWQNLARR